uniref:Ovule protein n=1 Tax=Heterorhabditis bacteriophora TaxID=37862 RepID=A0A1I7WZE5_HETBA
MKEKHLRRDRKCEWQASNRRFWYILSSSRCRRDFSIFPPTFCSHCSVFILCLVLFYHVCLVENKLIDVVYINQYSRN